MTFKSVRCAVVLALLFALEMTGFSQSGGPVARYSATTANTSSPGEAVRFDILRWSTDAEREQLYTAAGAGATAVPGVLTKAPTVGYVWTSESAGYSLRYAYRVAMPDGGERIILAFDRPLGSFEPERWKLTGAAKATGYAFTVVELHLAKVGMAEGKTSLATKVIADKDAKTIALEGYAAAPVMFQNVKKQ